MLNAWLKLGFFMLSCGKCWLVTSSKALSDDRLFLYFLQHGEASGNGFRLMNRYLHGYWPNAVPGGYGVDKLMRYWNLQFVLHG